MYAAHAPASILGLSVGSVGSAGPISVIARRAGWMLGGILLSLTVTWGSVGTLLADPHDSHDASLLYRAAILGMNYNQFGFVRRGIVGSLVRMARVDLLTGALVVHVVATTVFAIAAAWILSGSRGRLLLSVPLCIIGLDIILFWADDAGRTDPIVCGLLALACMAVASGRIIVACLCVAVGLTVHEASVIFGLPLIAALAFDRRLKTGSIRHGEGPSWLIGGFRVAAIAAILASVVLFQLFVESLPHASIRFVVDTIRPELPRADAVDWALYFALSGMRGVKVLLCQNAIDPNHGLHAVGACVVMLLTVFALAGPGRRGWVIALAIGLLPFFVLWVVANDMSRWATFGVCNIFLFCASRPDRSSWMIRTRTVCALIVILLQYPRSVWIENPIYVPSPVIEKVVGKLGGPPTPGVQAALDHCDPGWRSFLEAGSARPTK